MLLNGNGTMIVADVKNIPLTANGTAKFMTANVLAAVAAAFSWGFTTGQIQSALQSFIPGYETTPGRMNLFQFPDYNVLVDYAHNPHGLLGIKDYLNEVSAKRKVGIISGVGDRRDEDIISFASIAATMFDHIIIRQEHDLRGRTEQEINELIVSGLNRSTPTVTYEFIADERAAITHALQTATNGDYIVALSDQYQDVIDVIKQEMEKYNPVLPIQSVAPSIAS